jgi:hypothetical protein
MEHCMELFYDLWSLFGDTKSQTHVASKPSNLKGLAAISVISQGNVWDLCTVLDVDLKSESSVCDCVLIFIINTVRIGIFVVV